jgi:hypothetical protein
MRNFITEFFQKIKLRRRMKKYVKSLEIRKADIKAREKQWKNNI